MEKFQENIKKAAKSLQVADHMTYVTLPIVNENRLLIKIFDEIYKSVINSVNAVLNYEYMYKKIKLYKKNSENLKTFVQKCAVNYNLTHQQIKTMLEIINLNQKHKKSAMEFVKQNKIVILSDNLNTKTLDIIKIKEYLLTAKELLMQVNKKIKNN